MPTYVYQLAYTAESIAAQLQDPQDRLETAARPVAEAAGGKLLGGGFAFGEYDIVLLVEAPDDETMAAIALAVAAGGAVKSAKTTKLLSGPQYVESLKKAARLSPSYKPLR